jgi:hypothetical protein
VLNLVGTPAPNSLEAVSETKWTGFTRLTRLERQGKNRFFNGQD